MNIGEIIKDRRSIRKYEDRDVPEELVREIVENALWAPSGMNRQNWDVVVVRGGEKDRLLEVIAGAGDYLRPRLEKIFPEKMVNLTLQFFKNLGGAPVILLVYMPRIYVQFSPEMSNVERYHVEHDRMANLLSAAALIQNILLLARSRGLGTCWMTGPKYVEDQISDYLGVQDRELVSVIPLGYPDQKPPAPPRKEGKVRWIGFAQE